MTEKVEKGKQKRFGIKRKRSACQPIAFSEEELKKELLREARALKIPVGAAEAMVTEIAEKVAKWVRQRSAVTVDDIRQRIAREAEKYNADLAYVYKNHGKII